MMSESPNIDIDQLLQQNRDADLLRFTTAGSVDDGKSTLIGRLLNDCKCIYEDHLEAVRSDSKKLNREEVDLALLMDGLKAEREQGITIDVAYRYFSTPSRRFIIADSPGHEQYTRNMVTGASTANLAIVLIDARHGVLTQSKRHAFIASLLGIPHIIVAVNKMDLVDYSEKVFNDICKDYASYATKLEAKDLTYIPISALKGDNVVESGGNTPWYKGTTLLRHLETVHIGSDRNFVDFRFPVQYVNRPNLDFRGYCGTVASGIVRVGDEVVALPSGKTSKVKSIVTFDRELDYAFPPQSVTLCLEDEIDISRGDMLAHVKNIPHVERSIEAMIVWMSEDDFKPNKQYIIKSTTKTVRGSVTGLQYRIDPNELHRHDADTLELNQIGRVTLELFQPLACDEYSRNRSTGSFVMVDPMTNSTVAAGMIIERSEFKPLGSTDAGSDPVSKNISIEDSLVSAEMRERILGQKPATIWFTGLSGSGKSTISRALEKLLAEQGKVCYVLDGDNVRRGLNDDLGFSAEDRKENVRRVAEVARLFNEAGVVVVTAFISPYKDDREKARGIVGSDRFVEVFLDVDLSVCEERDPKGLYKKARAGKIAQFTGIDAPYEAPVDPELKINAGEMSVGDCASQVLAYLRERGIVPK